MADSVEVVPMSATRYDQTLPGDDIQGPFTVVLVVGREGQEHPFTSIVTADDLLGVRQYLYDALTSKALYEDARANSTTAAMLVVSPSNRPTI